MAKNKATNVHVHWPISARKCICGDVFPSEAQHLRHIKVFASSLYERGPRWARFTQKDDGNGKLVKAAQFHGHRLEFRKGLTLLPHMNKVVCSCGWSRYTDSEFPGPFGRIHVRGVVREIIG